MNFYCRLVPPRPGFAFDISAAEAEVMHAHAAYWREWMSRGHVIAFGVVADADGTFGVGLLDFDSESDARAFADDDPTLRSGLGFAIQIRPMPFGVVARDDDGVK